jgi:hypothetical protein
MIVGEEMVKIILPEEDLGGPWVYLEVCASPLLWSRVTTATASGQASSRARPIRMETFRAAGSLSQTGGFARFASSC